MRIAQYVKRAFYGRGVSFPAAHLIEVWQVIISYRMELIMSRLDGYPFFLQRWRVALIGLVPVLVACGISAAAEQSGVMVAQVQQMGLDELMNTRVETVSGASRFEQKVREAPSSVSLITSDDIKKFGYRTIADVLRSVRGFYVTYDRNYSYIGARGFGRTGDYNGRIIILIDGHRLNDNVYDQVLVGTEFPVDIDLIDRIEIVRGPSSSLYGNNAFFGVINILTKKGRDYLGAEASASAGGKASYGSRMSYGQEIQGVDFLASGTVYSSQGNRRLYYPEYDSPLTNNGVADRRDSDRSGSFFGKAAYKDLTLTAVGSSRRKAVPTGSYGTDFNSPNNKTTDSVGYLDLRYERMLGSDVKAVARLFYDYRSYVGTYDYAGVVNRDSSDGQWLGTEWQITATIAQAHRVVAGVEYRRNIRQDQKSYDEDPYSLKLDSRASSDVWSAYVQDEITLSDRWRISAGVRYDYQEQFGGKLNPRAGLIFNPTKTSALKLLYGTAFRAPNAYELFYAYSGTGGSKGNADLKPENMRMLEFVYEQALSDTVHVSAGAFSYRVRNLITQELDPSDGLLVFRNARGLKGRGVSAEVDARWDSGFRSRLAYTLQEVRDEETRQVPPNSPLHMVKGDFSIPVWGNKLFWSMNANFMSSRRTSAGEKTDTVFTIDTTLFAQRLLSGLECSASIYNILNRKFSDPVGSELLQDRILQDGRNFRVKITYLF